MNSFKELQEKYEKLKIEFENYQSFAESTIQDLNKKNMALEKNLDALSSIVEVSKYINSNLSNDNFISMINDMIIGIIGATYSSIYLIEKGKLTIKATNNSDYSIYDETYLEGVQKGRPFIINSKEPLFCSVKDRITIHSIVGVPVYIREKLTGFIIVEHTLYNFFNDEHAKFITSIANQIGIALENNFLYNKVKENSRRDPLLGIYNRRAFFDILENKINESPYKDFAIVMVDLDNFKKINDIYGHQFGDEVLIQTSRIIEDNIGKCDIAARYGGEEIVIYIDNFINHNEVFKKIDHIRQKISENIVIYGEVKRSITASFGIGYYSECHNDLKQVLKVADVMLYSAKRSGKNKVVSA